MGLLIRHIDEFHAKELMIDGKIFLRVFHRLVRLQERVLLGILEDNHIDISVLKPDFALSDKPEMAEMARKRPMTSPATFGTALGQSGPTSPSSRPESPEARLETLDREWDKTNSAKPMLPAVLGLNPWQDWGLAESGFAMLLTGSPFSRPATRGTKSTDYFGPAAEGGQELESTGQVLAADTVPAHSSSSTSFQRPLTALTAPSQSVVRPASSSSSGMGKVTAVRFSSLEPLDMAVIEFSADTAAALAPKSAPSAKTSSSSVRKSATAALMVRGFVKEAKDPLARVSLPACFSPMGMSRQEQRCKSSPGFSRATAGLSHSQPLPTTAPSFDKSGSCFHNETEK